MRESFVVMEKVCFLIALMVTGIYTLDKMTQSYTYMLHQCPFLGFDTVLYPYKIEALGNWVKNTWNSLYYFWNFLWIYNCIKIKVKKKKKVGNSLTVPWLRLGALTAMVQGSILGRELRSCKPHGIEKKQKKRKKVKKQLHIYITNLESNFFESFFYYYLFFSSTSFLLPIHLPPPSCTHNQSCNPMDFSPPDSSVHGFFQARILEWVAISFSEIFFKETIKGLPWWLSGEESPANAGDMGLIPGPGESHMRWSN